MRKLCAALMAVALVVFAVRAVAQSKSPVNARFLEGVYQDYNEIYFGDTLPKNVAILYSPDPDDATNVGDTKCSVDPQTMKPLTCTIYIAPYANQAQSVAMETMIHEMCHVETYQNGTTSEDAHGRSWKNCMLRIAETGGMDGVW